MEPIHDEAKGRFSLILPEGEAVLDYERNEAIVTFTHTFVPGTLRGRGLAEVLVRSGLAWARQNGLRTEATCSYVTAFLQRHPELASAPPQISP